MDECQTCSDAPPTLHHPAAAAAATAAAAASASAVYRLLFIRSHALSYTSAGSYMRVLAFIRTHFALLLCANYGRRGLFGGGALPATHGTLPACDPRCCVGKRSRLTRRPFTADRIPSSGQRRPPTAGTPLGRVDARLCELDI